MSEQNNIPAGVDFDKAEGESFVGLNLLALAVGQTEGPFVVEKIEQKEFGEGNRKKMLPQVTANKGNTPYIMPIAASFQQRLKEAALKKGDTFLIKRVGDYTSQEGTPGCHSYLLKVTERAGK